MTINEGTGLFGATANDPVPMPKGSLSGGVGALSITDAAILTFLSPEIVIINPAAAMIQVLPNTDVKAGKKFYFVMNATALNTVSVISANSDPIIAAQSQVAVKLTALVDNPSTGAGWQIDVQLSVSDINYILSHVVDTNNPHGTTKSQVGLSNVTNVAQEPANANIQSHIGSTSNPHNTNAGQVGAEPANANIQGHISSTGNTHSTKKYQISGLVPTAAMVGHITNTIIMRSSPNATATRLNLCWSPELAIFCSIGNTNGVVVTSPNGIDWTEVSTLLFPTSNWRGLCWSPELGLFCTTSMSGAHVATSPDGVTWTQSIAPIDASWKSVCWSPELGLFCAAASDYTFMISPDGTNWTNYGVSQSWNSICWSPELGLFCAVGLNKACTSPDGINWTVQTTPNNAWESVCWSPELSIFAAVATGASLGYVVMTSSNGILWTQRVSTENVPWKSIIWCADIHIFFAVASAGTNRFMTSRDGITWTAKNVSAQTWQTAVWCPQLGIICMNINITGTNTIATTKYLGYRQLNKHSHADDYTGGTLALLANYPNMTQLLAGLNTGSYYEINANNNTNMAQADYDTACCSNQGSILLKIRLNNLAGSGEIASKTTGNAAASHVWVLYVVAGVLTFKTSDGITIKSVVFPTITDLKWHTYVITWLNNGSTVKFVDGTQVGTDAAGSLSAPQMLSTQMKLGTSQSFYANAIECAISRFVYFNYAITADKAFRYSFSTSFDRLDLLQTNTIVPRVLLDEAYFVGRADAAYTSGYWSVSPTYNSTSTLSILSTAIAVTTPAYNTWLCIRKVFSAAYFYSGARKVRVSFMAKISVIPTTDGILSTVVMDAIYTSGYTIIKNPILSLSLQLYIFEINNYAGGEIIIPFGTVSTGYNGGSVLSITNIEIGNFSAAAIFEKENATGGVWFDRASNGLHYTGLDLIAGSSTQSKNWYFPVINTNCVLNRKIYVKNASSYLFVVSGQLERGTRAFRLEMYVSNFNSGGRERRVYLGYLRVGYGSWQLVLQTQQGDATGLVFTMNTNGWCAANFGGSDYGHIIIDFFPQDNMLPDSDYN